MKKYAALPLLAALMLGLTGCESVLSDVEIEDPNLIQVDGLILFSRTNGGAVSREIDVTLADKKGDPLELKGGTVSINDTPMKLSSGFLPHYKLGDGDIAIEAGTTYVLTVTLANGESHTGTITTQPQLVETLNVPTTHDPSQDLALSWNPDHPELITEVSLRITGPITTPEGGVGTFSSTESFAASGNAFVIPSAEFKSSGGSQATQATITVTETQVGSVSTSFRSGSFVSVCEVVEDVDLVVPTAEFFVHLVVEVL